MIDRNQVVSLYDSGQSLRQIGRTLSVSFQRISQILREENVETSDANLPKTYSNDTGVGRAINAAGGASALAERFGVSSEAVYQFHRKGWFPIDRAKQCAAWFDIPLVDMVSEKIASAIRASA
jgi:hypothetical protein